ncbi:glycosyltransferase [Halobacteriovorax marinus]|nr:glycosyltransferase [Halobacteriovorax marinus]
MRARPRGRGFLDSVLHSFLRSLSILWISIVSITILIRYRIRVVHVHSPMYLIVALFNKAVGGVNYITFHGSDYYRVKNKCWFRLFSKCICRVFCISPQMIDGMSNIFGESRVHIVPNGIDSNLKNNEVVKDREGFLGVGFLKNEKGFSFLIEGYAKFVGEMKSLKKEYPRLRIAGEGYLRGDLEELIKKLGLCGDVLLLGHLDIDKMSAEYLKSEFFILSSVSEGFPKVVLEAFKSGCKVVLTNVGSCSTIVGDEYPFLINHSSSDEISKALVSIVDDRSFDFRGLRRDVLFKYSWENVMSKYDDQWSNDVFDA